MVCSFLDGIVGIQLFQIQKILGKVVKNSCDQFIGVAKYVKSDKPANWPHFSYLKLDVGDLVFPCLVDKILSLLLKLKFLRY